MPQAYTLCLHGRWRSVGGADERRALEPRVTICLSSFSSRLVLISICTSVLDLPNSMLLWSCAGNNVLAQTMCDRADGQSTFEFLARSRPASTLIHSRSGPDAIGPITRKPPAAPASIHFGLCLETWIRLHRYCTMT